MEYLTEKCIHVCGMNRSGQHAISDSILYCFKSGLYRNNVGFHIEKLSTTPVFSINNNSKYCNFRYQHIESGFIKGTGINLLDSRFSKDRNVIIYGSEMVTPETFINGYNECYQKNEKKLIEMLNKKNKDYNLVGVGKSNFFVFILRSPWNNAASGLFWRKKEHLINDIDFFSKIWIETAKEFVGETNYIKENLVPVLYDKWIVDEEYRKSICKKIGIEYSVNVSEKISRYGGGSSFTYGTLSPPTTRWEIAFEIPEFQRHIKTIMSNSELLRYSNILFGPPPF